MSAVLATSSTLPSNSLKFADRVKMCASAVPEFRASLMSLLKMVGDLFSGMANPMKVPSVTGSERGLLLFHISLGDSCCVLVWLSRMYDTLLVGEFSPSWKRRK